MQVFIFAVLLAIPATLCVISDHTNKPGLTQLDTRFHSSAALLKVASVAPLVQLIDAVTR